MLDSAGGPMKDYGEVLAGMTQFFVHTHGLDPGIAGATAKQAMSTLLAWRATAEAKAEATAEAAEA